jgi:hypothetical protein
MKKIIKKFKSEYNKSFSIDNNIEDIKKEVVFINTTNNHFKRKLIFNLSSYLALFIGLVLIIISSVLFSYETEEKKEPEIIIKYTKALSLLKENSTSYIESPVHTNSYKGILYSIYYGVKEDVRILVVQTSGVNNDLLSLIFSHNKEIARLELPSNDSSYVVIPFYDYINIEIGYGDTSLEVSKPNEDESIGHMLSFNYLDTLLREDL